MKTKILQYRTQGDFNRLTYSLRRSRSKRNSTTVVEYSIEYADDQETKVKRELARGKQFFTKKDGLLFGAMHELRKLGTIKTKEIY